MTITMPDPNQTIFIGDTVQLSASATLSDGSSEERTGTWGSQNTAVATVDQNGLLTAVGPGEATIFVEVNPRGTLRIRVFPQFEGTWQGSHRITSCRASGDFLLFGDCSASSVLQVGAVLPLDADLSQNAEQVSGTMFHGGFSVATNGNISTGGLLRPFDAFFVGNTLGFRAVVENRRLRADFPGRMTGTFRVVKTNPTFRGSTVTTHELRNMNRVANAVLSPRRTGGGEFERGLQQLLEHLKRSHRRGGALR